MSMITNVRNRRLINRESRALDRVWHTATTQSMRNEIIAVTQRKVF